MMKNIIYVNIHSANYLYSIFNGKILYMKILYHLRFDCHRQNSKVNRGDSFYSNGGVNNG